MARARNVKPGFLTNGDLLECDPLARLLFVGLWMEADREGRLEDRPKTIKVKVLPGDDCDIERLLTQLSDRSFIKRYEANGKRYVQITNWAKHQQPHYKEVASEIPPPPGHIDSPVVTFGATEETRQRIFDRDGRRCMKCGSEERLSLDHIIPRTKGGSGDDDNLQTLCLRCNTAKGNRLHSSDVGSTSNQDRTDVGSSKSLNDPLIPDSLNLIPSPVIPDPLEEQDIGRGGDEKPPSKPDRPPKPTTTEVIDADFHDRFYGPYPRHVKRDDALKAWIKLKPSDRDAAAEGLQRWLEAAAFSPEMGFVPHPTTWLNEGRWKDDVRAVNPGKPIDWPDWIRKRIDVHLQECAATGRDPDPYPPGLRKVMDDYRKSTRNAA